MIDLYRILPEEMDNLVIELGQPKYRAEQLLRALYHESPRKMSDLHQIPSVMRDALIAAGYTIGSENEVHRVASEDGHTTKLLLKFDNQTLIETVLMQYSPSQDKTHPKINCLCFYPSWLPNGLCVLCHRPNGF